MTIDAGRFTWFEYLTNDDAKAIAFYTELLPWRVDRVPMAGAEYPIIEGGGAKLGGFAPLPKGVSVPQWLAYVSVDDIAQTVARVTAAGGKALMDAVDLPGVGRMQPIADPQGGTLMLFRALTTDGDKGSGPGAFHWNELWCPDAPAALAFYERAFGYTHDVMDMPTGPYYVLRNGDQSRGGIMASPVASMPTHWLPYVAVADLDATLARTRRLGGRVEGEPIHAEGVGRFAFLRDPAGARLGVITPAAR